MTVGDSTFRDVIILGGGPAGSAMAIELRQHDISVALIERSNYEAMRIGEILPPQASSLLDRLGLWETFIQEGHRASPGIVSAWASGIPQETDFIFRPHGNGWVLDRAKFDAMFASAAERTGALVLRGAQVRNCNRLSENWEVAIRHQSTQTISSRLVIDATGRSAWFARQQGTERTSFDRLVGIAAYHERSSRSDQRLLLEAFEEGWWYSSAAPEGGCIAVCMTDADFIPRQRDQLGGFYRRSMLRAPLTFKALGADLSLNNLRTFSANTSRLNAVHGLGWMAIGDAAAAYDPISSQGIYKALESARDASEAVVDWIKHGKRTFSQYADGIYKGFEVYRRDYRYHYGQVRRWSDSRFWQRREPTRSTFHEAATMSLTKEQCHHG